MPRSYEPQSAMQQPGAWTAWRPEPKPPKPTRDLLKKPQPPSRRRRYKVAIEPPRERREAAMQKLMTTTEALTAVERAAVQRYRAVVTVERDEDR